jgi:hypothetical protein
MDVGWNGGRCWRPQQVARLRFGDLNGSIVLDGKVVRSGHSGDVPATSYYAGPARHQVGEHGKTLNMA